MGTQEKKAKKAPCFSTQCLRFKIVFSETPNFFNQFGFPILPIQKLVAPPNTFPVRASVKHNQGFIPCVRKKTRIISELKGKIVAAKNEAKNKPTKPSEVKSKIYNFFKDR